MSAEPDYNFNQPSSSASDNGGIQLPFAILTLAIAVVFITNTVNTFKAKGALQENKASIATLIENRKQLVDQSAQIQKNLSDMLEDLLTLAMTDKDAKAIADKYGIKKNPRAGSGS